MESRNQLNQRRNKSYYYDREDPIRTIILSSEVDENSVYNLIEMICEINDYDDDNDNDDDDDDDYNDNDAKYAWLFFFNIEIADRGYGEIGSNDILGRHTRAVRTIK